MRAKNGPRDGLKVSWWETCMAARNDANTVFYNPPYSDPGPWVEKAAIFTGGSSRCEAVGLMLPSYDTEWWADNVWPHAAALCFVTGRFKFLKRGIVDTAPRANSVYIMHASSDVRNESIRRFVASFGLVGQVITNRTGWGT